LNTVDRVIESARADMANFQIHKALAAIIDVVADGDRYFASQEPWALKKTDPARMETVLYVTAETVRQISILLQPFMPESAAKLLDLLGIPTDKRDFKRLEKPAVWKRERRSTSRRRSFRAMSRPRRGEADAG
jgi:methionyl-tRNA synthetase